VATESDQSELSERELREIAGGAAGAPGCVKTYVVRGICGRSQNLRKSGIREVRVLL